VSGQVPEVFAHLRRPGGAVEADEVDLERFDGGERRTDLAAEQHRARRLDRDLREQRQLDAGRSERSPGAVDRRLGLQQVLRGLDEDGV
jgi:hypothetical protein